ncbi:hypothetical protein DSM101010T_04590 [Desulfovibrio subterraneus]|uniref:Uncharacterized protein n=1 Tax=Desulfovibrio subterraneus TaxID=2718620 RepID=A0A7J0BG07_9BACT|nr:hypothetical protein DSM101010T_04590 [Desulfovibrio subterraneus]
MHRPFCFQKQADTPEQLQGFSCPETIVRQENASWMHLGIIVQANHPPPAQKRILKKCSGTCWMVKAAPACCWTA